MAKKSKKEAVKVDFNELYADAPDEQIIEILKKREHYQKEAADAAIDEAIKREIIYSEQDLLGEEYRTEPMKFVLFPPIENENSRRKVRKSLIRSLLFVGAIILSWGILGILQYDFKEGVAFAILGISWELIAYSFFKSVKQTKVNILIGVLGATAVYAVATIMQRNSFVVLDIFIFAILFVLVLYGLLYLNKLSK